MSSKFQEVKQRIEKLKKVINYHRYLYHVLDKQEISDAALDSLKKELFDLEQKFPEFITPDSPTQRVEGKPLERFNKIRHPVPMLSFNDAFSKDDIKDWIERISKLLTPDEAAKIDFYCEPKLDGLAMELIYKDGILKTGATRGNGVIGEDVTQNLKTIEAIPLKLRETEEVIEDLEKEGLKDIAKIFKKEGLKEIIVRGEIIISKKIFERVNQKQKKLGQNLYANPRNLAAGSIRQLDPKVAAFRYLDANVYDLITELGQKTHSQEHKIFKILGFKTNNKYSKYCKRLDEVFNFHNYWRKNRQTLPYEIDGIVATINSNEIFEKLGVVGKAPRGAIAFKFPLKQATTIIKDIKIQIGRTGAITPVAVLKPVKVGGVTISRATLHNEDEIKRLGVKIGDTVIVGRAGDVIPDIVKVLQELRTGKEKGFKMPQKCPSCGTKLIKPENEVVWRCPNPDCFARQRKYFYHFISKGSFDMVSLGPKIIDQLISKGLISDPADLFELEEGDLVPLERFAQKKSENIIKAIQSKREITLPRLIFALGIKNVGEEKSIDLAEDFGSLENLKKANTESLEKLMDIGPKVAESIYNWFHQKRNLEFLEKLEKVGVKIISQKSRLRPSGFGRQAKVKTQKLKGLIFVLTGQLQSMTRAQAKEKIRSSGAKVLESVSGNINYAVVGKNPGSTKLEKAEKLKIKIMGEKEFLEMIK